MSEPPWTPLPYRLGPSHHLNCKLHVRRSREFLSLHHISARWCLFILLLTEPLPQFDAGSLEASKGLPETWMLPSPSGVFVRLDEAGLQKQTTNILHTYLQLTKTPHMFFVQMSFVRRSSHRGDFFFFRFFSFLGLRASEPRAHAPQPGAAAAQRLLGGPEQGARGKEPPAGTAHLRAAAE